MSHEVKLATLRMVVRILRSVSLRMQRLPHRQVDKGADGRGFVIHRGHRLPPTSMRGNMCGDAFRTDSFFYMSAVLEATKLAAKLGYAPGARVVDIGCGLGRLATGMLAEFGDAQYLGIDVQPEFVRWSRDNIERFHPSYRFIHMDMANELYNPAGSLDETALHLPIDDGWADIVYLWGVFTNMVPRHVESYVGEIRRILRPRGRCFLTAFVEDDVPDATVNPTSYVPYNCSDPLLVVRYSRDWLFSTFQRNGLEVEDFRYHGSMFPQQSEIYLAKGGTRLDAGRTPIGMH
ncbi:methyltransferase domain-containing protein [Ramlibacter sp. MAH-25]|uniref:Methyltransferase domain-containing protein n=1 Tax=Ramlibacter pinisoli TaxID=2682844 RepID=A0A6N8IRB2_9BURK|nr:methyltransferase domain-containing protein [Ramlibacter pinisoli]